MSDRPTILLLYDILDAIDKICSYTEGMDFQNFKENGLVRDAVERNIGIIGEAANKVSNDFKNENPNVEWHKPIAMRNRLIHGYFSIDIPMLWNTIKVILPPFRMQIASLLNIDNK